MCCYLSQSKEHTVGVVNLKRKRILIIVLSLSRSLYWLFGANQLILYLEHVMQKVLLEQYILSELASFCVSTVNGNHKRSTYQKAPHIPQVQTFRSLYVSDLITFLWQCWQTHLRHRQSIRPPWHWDLAYGIWNMKSIMVNIDRLHQFVSNRDWDWYTCAKWPIAAEDWGPSEECS